MKRGDFCAIQGPSGSGKSTLLNIMGLLDRPSTGALLIDGEDTVTWSDRKRSEYRNRRIGFILQDFGLIQNETALYNIGLPMYLAGASKSHIRTRVEELLTLLDIEGQVQKRVKHMSGGQKQRVAIARALVNQPDLILADEPTGALDTENSELVLETLTRMNREEALTVLLVTHDPRMAAYADKVLIMEDGSWRT